MSHSILTKDNIQAFLDRFHACGDGLIHSFEMMMVGRGEHHGKLVLSVQDAQNHNEWVNLVLSLEQVHEFILSEEHQYTSHVLFEVKYAWFDDLLFLCFSGDLEDGATIDNFRQSTFFFASKKCTWELAPYASPN